MDLVALITLVLALALVGFIVYLIVTYIPMPAPFPQIIIAIVAVVLVLWLLSLLSGHLALPRLR